MTTTQEHMAARNDADLRERLIAKAEQLGMSDPGQRIYEVMGRLISVPVAKGQCIADVYAFASSERDRYIAATPPRPGEDTTKVIDEYLEAALRTVLTGDIEGA